MTYAYDVMGRLSAVTADGKEFTYTYMPNAPQLLSQVTSPVHTVENIWEPTRDTLAVKTNKWKNKANTPVISAYAYTVNNLGQRTSVTTSGEVFATTSADRVWQYDSLGQVISANDNHYTYDQIGNRTTTQEGTEQPVAYTPNSLNQYAVIGDIIPTYDADGNQFTGLQATTALPERNQPTFVYNAQNRPIQVKQNSTIRENYTYDHQGRRTQKGDTLTLYDGYNSIAYPTYNGNGNITEYLTEENNGTLAAHYEYDAFGNVVKKTGEKEYGYQFSTKLYDEVTNLLYYNYRNYNPLGGRWINRDPIGEAGGLNLYCFLRNNSIHKYDVLGREDFDCKEKNLGQISNITYKIKISYGLTGDLEVKDPGSALKDGLWDAAKGWGLGKLNNVRDAVADGMNGDYVAGTAKALVNELTTVKNTITNIRVDIKAECCHCNSGNYQKKNIQAVDSESPMIELSATAGNSKGNNPMLEMANLLFSLVSNTASSLRSQCDTLNQ